KARAEDLEELPTNGVLLVALRHAALRGYAPRPPMIPPPQKDKRAHRQMRPPRWFSDGNRRSAGLADLPALEAEQLAAADHLLHLLRGVDDERLLDERHFLVELAHPALNDLLG